MLVIKHSLSSQSKTEMYGGVKRPNKKIFLRSDELVNYSNK